MSLRIPRKIGTYTLLEQIGVGSMGAVYRAQDKTNGLLAALKFVRMDPQLEEEARHRFLRGAELAAGLNHPNIQRVYNYGESGGFLYLASEYLEGNPLKSLIRSDISGAQKVDWMVQMCQALEYAHQKGVIHRDIKPANIFVTASQTIVITDFGIARGLSSDITHQGVIIGTPEYMSPEQVMVTRLDYRTDIFSLGIVFYELLSGRHPFRDQDISKTIHAIMNDQPDPVHPIVMKMIEKDQNNRYQSCAEIIQSLQESDSIKRI